MWRVDRDAAVPTFTQHTRAEVTEALRQFATTFEINDEEIEAIADQCEIETFGQGEIIVAEGAIPSRFSCIMSGLVRVTTTASDGANVVVSEQDRGEIVGTSALLREGSPTASEASTIVDVLQMPMVVIDQLAAAKPSVARTLSDLIQTRRAQIRSAFETVNAGSEMLTPITSVHPIR